MKVKGISIMRLRKKILLAAACAAFASGALSLPAQACTLFSAAGEGYVADGGVLIAKNRDAKPGKQFLKVATPKDGYRYYGVFVDDKINGDLRGGINEKGLAIVCATASSIPADARKALGRFHSEYGVTDEYLISQFATVDEVLRADKEIWKGPQYIMLADKTKIAIVEIGPDGNISVRETKNGTLNHTNHYVNPEMLWVNQKVSEGTKTRKARIAQLLDETKKPFVMEDFIRFSQDKNAGPTDSIYRDGIENSSQTLANFIVHIPPKGTPEIFVKYRENPDEKGKEQVYRLTADEVFGR